MIYRIAFAFALLLGLFLLPAGTVSAQNTPTTMTAPDISNLPPGIAEKVEPLLEALMQKMQEMPMDQMEHPPMHAAHLQALIDELPPGILVQVLEAMLQFNMDDMMAFHEEMAEGLLDQPPGQVLIVSMELAQLN